MPNKLQELTARLKSSRFEGVRQAWGQYKGLVGANRGGAAAGLAAAAGYGILNEGQDPISSTLVLGPVLAGVGAAIQVGGGMDMLKGKGSQMAAAMKMAARAPSDWKGPAGAAYRSEFEAAAANNPFMKGFRGMTTSSRSEFLSRSITDTDYAGQAARILSGVDDAIPMHLQYAAIASAVHTTPGDQPIMTLGQLAQDEALGGFAGKFATKESIMAHVEGSPEFARQFAMRAGDFEGMSAIGTMAPIGEHAKARFIGSTREGLVGRLRAQGRGDLASEITRLDPNVRVTGIGQVGSDTISALQYNVGGVTFRAPMVGPDGTVKAGLFSKNTNVARRQIFLGSLEGMAAGGRPEVVSLDMAVAKTLRTYHAAAAETMGGTRNLANYLAGMANLPIEGLPGGVGLARGTGSALAWTNPARPDRVGLATSSNVAIRQMDVQLNLPGSSLLGSMNLQGFLNNNNMISAETIMGLRNTGFAPLGSEGSARTNTFVQMTKMTELFPGAHMTPMDKSMRGIRDFSKPYWTTGGGPAARRPFASYKLNQVMGNATGLAMHYNMIFESEADFLSELLNTGRLGSTKAAITAQGHANKTIEQVMGRSMSSTELRQMRGALTHIANMREGQFAAAIGPDVNMVSQVEKVMYTLPDDIATLAPGAALPANRPIGFDAANRPVHHSFARLGGGTATLQSITPITEGGRTAYIVRWNESIAGANVKWGSDVGKMYSLGMKQSQVPLVQQFINNLRKSPIFRSRLYAGLGANQPYAPMMGGIARGSVAAFTLAGTFGKFQSAPEVMMSALHDVWMPQMDRVGRATVRSMFRKHGLKSTRAGVVSNFTGGAQIESAFAAAKAVAGRMVADPTAFGLSPSTFVGAAGQDPVATMLMRGGMVSEAIPWDALNLNVPKNVPISTNQISIMREYGLDAGVDELLSRRRMTGDAKATEAYKLAMARFASPGAKMPSNMPVINLDDWNTSLGAAKWRGSDRVQQNFLIDLEIAGKQLDAATLKQTLGISNLRIPVPGVNTDFWRAPYRTTGGVYASSEAWASPLQRLLKSVERMYQGEAVGGEARHALSQYLNAIRRADADLTVGRGGSVYDAGKSIAGTLQFRDYSRLYQGHSTFGGRASQFMVGINPQDYRRLAGGAEYATGYFTRFPATTVDAVMLVADETVARGAMAFDETRRALMGADFDGDVGYVSIIKNQASVTEAKGVIFGGTSQAAKYDEAQAARALLGGVGDDLGILGKAAARNKYGFENIMDAVTSRLGKFTSIFTQDEGTVLAKSHTQFIGRFSNLANEMIMGTTAMGSTTQRLRSQLLRDIQQAAIDFGRKSGKGVDPGAIARMLDDTVAAASGGNIDLANELFASVMMKLNVGSDIDVNLSTLRAANAGNAGYISSLDTWAKELQSARLGFFEHMRGNTEMQLEFGRRAVAQKLLHKKVFDTMAPAGSLDEVRDAVAGIDAHLAAQAQLGDQGIPSIGVASAGESAARLTAWNRMKAGAAGTTHILSDAMAQIRASTSYAGIKGGAIATLGLMAAGGMLTSPTEMSDPRYGSAQSAVMQSPDVALAGMSGTPMPGSTYGHAHRGGEIRNPRRVDRPTSPENTIPRRYYVNQTNRVPRIRFNSTGDTFDQNLFATEASSQLQRLAGGDTRINIVHDATSRRMSELEFQDKMREDLRGGR